MIASKTIKTTRLETHYFECGDPGNDIILLLHGNVSSAMFFLPLMEQLLGQPFYFLAPDMRGFGDSETKPVDALRGVKDFAEDLVSFLQAINTANRKVHLLGWSLGGTVVLQAAMDFPQKIASITLVSPMSPFGFGASRNTGLLLEACDPDFAGSGGGAVNPAFIDSIRTHDGEIPSSQPEPFRANPQAYARTTMNSFYFKAIDGKTLSERGLLDKKTEDMFVASMFRTKLGDENYPGSMTTSTYWPGMAPGDKGVNNAISAKYCNISSFASSGLHIPVLWIRGADDMIVSDASALDVNNLGKLGIIPGWPGEATHPPQPMVIQMRSVLEAYQQNDGSYQEVVFENCGHSPHIEQPEQFRETWMRFVKKV